MSARPALAGYLNLIHPNRVQVLGREELDYLEALAASGTLLDPHADIRTQPAGGGGGWRPAGARATWQRGRSAAVSRCCARAKVEL